MADITGGAGGRASALAPLRIATFRSLAAAYTVNQFGSWVGDIALAVLVYGRTHSPLDTAALFLAIRFLPALLAPMFTARVESVHARRLLPALYLGETLIFAVIAVLTRHFSLPALLVLGVLDGMLSITSGALTRSATTTTLRDRDVLREGNAILNLGFTLGGATGPVIAGAVVAGIGTGAALLIDAGSFLLAAVILVLAPQLQIDSQTRARWIERSRLGIDEVRRRPWLRTLVCGQSVALIFFSIPVPVEIVFAEHTLHAGNFGYGLLLTAWGVGMVAGGGIFASGRRFSLGLLIVAGTVLVALSYGGIAVSPDLVAACVFSAIGGIGNGVQWIAVQTGIQEDAPSASQSSVFALVGGIYRVMPAVGFALGGVIADTASTRVAFAVSAVGIAVTLVWCVALATSSHGHGHARVDVRALS